MEGYRSGHNGAVLKTVWGQPHKGSSPLPSDDMVGQSCDCPIFSLFQLMIDSQCLNGELTFGDLLNSEMRNVAVKNDSTDTVRHLRPVILK